MRLLIPILRADFAINETYAYTQEEPFDFGISAFGGLGDEEVTREDVAAWQEHTRGRFRMRMLPGDHFFLHAPRTWFSRPYRATWRRSRRRSPRAVTGFSARSPGRGWGSRGRDPRLVHPSRSARRAGRAPGPRSLGRRVGAGKRFRFEQHRRQYVVGRGALRTLLGRLPGRPAGAGPVHLRSPRQAFPGPAARRRRPAVQPLELRRAGPGGLRARPRDRGRRRAPAADAGLRADLRALLLGERAAGRCGAIPAPPRRRPSSTAGRARRPTSRRWGRGSRRRSTPSTSPSPRAIRRACSPSKGTPSGPPAGSSTTSSRRRIHRRRRHRGRAVGGEDVGFEPAPRHDSLLSYRFRPSGRPLETAASFFSSAQRPPCRPARPPGGPSAPGWRRGAPPASSGPWASRRR